VGKFKTQCKHGQVMKFNGRLPACHTCLPKSKYVASRSRTMSDAEPETEDRPSTWQSRCPLKPVIEPRAQAKKITTTAQKISNNEKRLMKKKDALALQEEVDKYFEERAALITKLSEQFSKTPEYVQSLLSRSSNAVSHRGINLENALIHFESKKLNAGE
jgi:hypothetical protein